ncbi:Alkylated DNA repair dioxygenase AlkB [Polaribacter sp. KT25b]|uniref:alpha-ketoglutarate-dependent dioxygenase AlkB n=1 Tax=Polaribacter sp. KT25b TaxID=1855336 RepID=UPI000879A1A8|nr:alpha-ketoglutarate-dependent dioxygenase AlkB [Polaribacter sp. KT25b]SDR67064.1 Alkylated DNA repair dioxygenase AlkB [Polaribacter sp. KT25b]
MSLNNNIFKEISLDEEASIWKGKLPIQFDVFLNDFDEIWNLHPQDFHLVRMFGKMIPTPRWQQAYGKNYEYSGSLNNALPIPDFLNSIHKWCKSNIDERLNGLLINWYDGEQNHYIGAHRDDEKDIIKDSVIVTISLGEERIFRMRPWKKKGFKDLLLAKGDIIILPMSVNSKWTHEVPNFNKYKGRRISITLRVFNN